MYINEHHDFSRMLQRMSVTPPVIQCDTRSQLRSESQILRHLRPKLLPLLIMVIISVDNVEEILHPLRQSPLTPTSISDCTTVGTNLCRRHFSTKLSTTTAHQSTGRNRLHPSQAPFPL